MKKLTQIAALAVAIQLAGVGVASAKDLCLTDVYGGDYILSKIKLPKKPGSTTLLQGLRTIFNSSFSVVSGVASRRASGVLVIALTVQRPNELGNDFTLSWTTANEDLSGTAAADFDGDYLRDDGFVTMSATDCSQVIIP